VGSIADQRAGRMQGAVALRPRTQSGAPPLSDDPTTPRWEALPVQPVGARASAIKRKSRGPCGCRGPCSHRGGR
jgi:hypothetical protein